MLGGATVTLNAVHPNRREIRLAGLPAGYALRRSDALAFSYGTNPVRFARHRIVAPAVAAANGLTPFLEVVPNLRPGFAPGTAVSLLAPACKAVLLPGSAEPGRLRQRMTVGASFKWIQTLR